MSYIPLEYGHVTAPAVTNPAPRAPPWGTGTPPSSSTAQRARRLSTEASFFLSIHADSYARLRCVRARDLD
jgi:hypothetical protein